LHLDLPPIRHAVLRQRVGLAQYRHETIVRDSCLAREPGAPKPAPSKMASPVTNR
jgi:hypothetical protein